MRLIAALLGALVGLYWFGVGLGSAFVEGGATFRFSMAALALAWTLVAVSTLAIPPSDLPQRRFIRPLAGSFGLFAAAFPVLLYFWTRGDYERTLWVMRQLYPCSAMGGGPGSLWVGATSLIASFAALSFALLGPVDRRLLRDASLVGIVLIALTAASMFVEPALFARVLGCL